MASDNAEEFDFDDYIDPSCYLHDQASISQRLAAAANEEQRAGVV